MPLVLYRWSILYRKHLGPEIFLILDCFVFWNIYIDFTSWVSLIQKSEIQNAPNTECQHGTQKVPYFGALHIFRIGLFFCNAAAGFNFFCSLYSATRTVPTWLKFVGKTNESPVVMGVYELMYTAKSQTDLKNIFWSDLYLTEMLHLPGARNHGLKKNS